MIEKYSVVTDTSTIAVFDLEAIRHRMNDTADWWSIADDEILEVNQGNIAFLGLGGMGNSILAFLMIYTTKSAH